MKSLFSAPLALACGIALAQPSPIYRCGDSYGSQPCAGGREISAETPSPTSAERRDAAAAAQRDARIADNLEKDRLKQEARSASSSSYIPSPEPKAQPTPYKSPEKNATRKLDVFTASGPAPSKPEKKEKSAKGGGKKGKASDEAKPTKPTKPPTKPAKDAKPAHAGRVAVKR